MRFPTPKLHNKTLSSSQSAPADCPGPTNRPLAGTAQEAVGPSPGPCLSPDARGHAPRKNSRSALPGVDADARGHVPRKNSRSALPGVDADARGAKPRKNSRSFKRGKHRRIDRRIRPRSTAFASVSRSSMPRLSPHSPDLDGEIAVLRSLTNRLLSTPSPDHTYLSRYLRILVRAVSARSRMPKQLTDQEEIDSLIKKYFYKKVDDGGLSFNDLLPVRTAQPGDKWWPWRNLISVEKRHEDGLIGPDDRLPQGMDEYLEKRAADKARLAEMDEMELRILDGWFEPDPDDDDPCPNNPYPDPDDQDEYWPGPAEDDAPDSDDYYSSPENFPEEDEQWPDLAEDTWPDPNDDDEYPTDLTVTPNPPAVPAGAEPAPSEGGGTPPNPDPVPPPAPRIARGRPPP